jgi:hypothetical protein
LLAAGVTCLLALSALPIVAGQQMREDTCDDACVRTEGAGVDQGTDWWHSSDAWQWEFQFYLTIAGALLLAIALGAVLFRRDRIAGGLCLAALALYVVWAAAFIRPP